jgi:hypothetical protein
VQSLKTRHRRTGNNLHERLEEILSNNEYMVEEYRCPGRQHDELFEASYSHPEGNTCDRCDRSRLVRRLPERQDDKPKVHYGNIASGDEVMEDGPTRDRIAREEGILSFEMEAAGLMDTFPCVVIRGVCDYADSHKNKRWQPYAAMTAACYCKELLGMVNLPGVVVTLPASAPFPAGDIVVPTTSSDQRGRETLCLEGNKTLFPSKTCLADGLLGFLKSLSYPEMEYRYHNIENAQTATCDWLLASDCYRDWNSRHGTSHFLLIYGKPGSGKSTAMKSAVRFARDSAGTNSLTLAFFFNSRGAAIECTVEGFFRSTLHQFFSYTRDAQDEAIVEWERKSRLITRGWAWTVHELHLIFKRVIGNLSAPMTVFVDALDECRSRSEARDLMDLLYGSSTNSGIRMLRPKICVSSRHHPNFGTPTLSIITVENTNQDNILRHVRTELRKLLVDLPDLPELIARRSRGMFLWAVLVLEKIRIAREDGATQTQLSSLVNLVPDRLEDLFQELVDSTTPDQVEERNCIIWWTLYAKRPLSLTEITHALAFRRPYSTYKQYEESGDLMQPEDMKKLLASRTRGLVEFVETRKWLSDTAVFILQFMHESVREYVLKHHSLFGFHSPSEEINAGLAHYELAVSSFNYIKAVCTMPEIVDGIFGPDQIAFFKPDNLLIRLNGRFGFLDYATIFALPHVELSEAHGKACSHLFRDPDGDNACPPLWWVNFTKLFMRNPRVRTSGASVQSWIHLSTSPLAFACAFTIDTLFCQLLADGITLHIQADFPKVLCVAASCGNSKCVSRLLERGADIDFDKGRPLYLSLLYNRIEVAQLLIDKGASLSVGLLQYNAFVVASTSASVEATRLLVESAQHQNLSPERYRNSCVSAFASEFRDDLPPVYQAMRQAVIAEIFRGQNHITLFVKTLSGKTLTLNMASHATLGDLLQRYQDAEGPPPNMIMFVHRKKVLRQDNQLLSDYGIQNCSVVHALLRARWGGTHGG